MMKKFESLGRSLTREEMKAIGGGNYLACPEGQTEYSCCVEWVDPNTPTSTETICSDTPYHAKGDLIAKHPNLIGYSECS